jgi:hypothetical protein
MILSNPLERAAVIDSRARVFALPTSQMKGNDQVSVRLPRIASRDRYAAEGDSVIERLRQIDRPYRSAHPPHLHAGPSVTPRGLRA